MYENYILQHLRDEILYRTERCIEVWDDKNQIKKFAEFKAFIFSIGSALDLIRVRIFNEFPPKKGRKDKYFSDLIDKNGFISQDFRKFTKEKSYNSSLITSLLNNKIRKIFFTENYNGFYSNKKFTLWKIYISLKHISIPEKSNICFILSNSLAGQSGDLKIEVFDKDEKRFYTIEFYGKPVIPESAKAEDLDTSPENQTLLWIKYVSKEIIEFLNSLEGIFKKHK